MPVNSDEPCDVEVIEGCRVCPYERPRADTARLATLNARQLRQDRVASVLPSTEIHNKNLVACVHSIPCP
jgi:hypothetical protein